MTKSYKADGEPCETNKPSTNTSIMDEEQNEYPSLEPCAANEATAAIQRFRATNKLRVLIVGERTFYLTRNNTIHLTFDLISIMSQLTSAQLAWTEGRTMFYFVRCVNGVVSGSIRVFFISIYGS